jgi:membrane-bound lytic murein transglycosylase B
MMKLTFLLCLLTLSHSAYASDFKSWVVTFKSEAMRQGVTSETYDIAFKDVAPNLRTIELDRKQPERTKMGFSKYLSNVMSQARIDNGRVGLSQNITILNSVESHYGVPAEIIVSLWGVETSYGKNTGGFDLISALATLAWEGRRAAFFKNELIKALLILQGDHITRENFKGSWAGAMGQNQFMPSSWHRYAVDFNGDGHKDIWTTKSDVFASAANYLAENGWDKNLKWGWAVTVPSGLSANKQKMTYTEWLRLGVRFNNEHPPSIAATTPLTLVIPDGGDGRTYLVTKNFDVIMSWNRSTYFALTVGLLSDFIGQNKATIQINENHLNQ